MNNNEIPVIINLFERLEKISRDIEESKKENNLQNFNELKKEFLEVQKEISKKIK
ncbi:MAG TPA: hypothetical protein VJ912_02320 [Candidatus Nanoarchaeia archaeon]|nr:hypothetical protein [Candidatus Nanoarchaeia archaeon]